MVGLGPTMTVMTVCDSLLYSLHQLKHTEPPPPLAVKPLGRGPGLRVQWDAGSLRTCAAFFIPDDGRRVPRGWVSALGRKPSVVSSSQVATPVLLGTRRRSVATYLWKRLALSLRQEDRSSPEVSFSFESLLSWLCVAPYDPCLGSTAARSDGESRLIFQIRAKDGCGENSPVESKAGEFVEN